MKANGTFDSVNFTPSGLAGIFAIYAAPGAKLGQAFVMELVCVSVPNLTHPTLDVG